MTQAQTAEHVPVAAAVARPRARWVDDLLVSVFGVWAVLGTVLDSWAHFSGRVDSFFTPWHAVLYSGTFAMVGWLVWTAWRCRGPVSSGGPAATVGSSRAPSGRGTVPPEPPGAGRQGLPVGYGIGLVGVAMFLVGAAGDLTWHTILGIEVNLDGAFSPTHLTLILAGWLLFTTPFRSAWAAPGTQAPLPALLALLNVEVLLAMATSWAAAWGNLGPTLPIHQPAESGTIEGYITEHAIVSVLVTSLVMLGPVLLALRRWHLPFGTVTLLFTAFALAQAKVHASEGAVAIVVAAATLGGLTADALIALPASALNARTRDLLVAVVTPLVTWSAWLLVLAADQGRFSWTPALSTGTVVIAALGGFGLHLLLWPSPSR